MYRTCIPRGQAYRATWEKRFADWNGNKEAWEVGQEGKGLPGWEAKLPSFDPDGDPIATRQALNTTLNATAEMIPAVIPGSADLTGNTGVALEGSTPQSAEHPGGNSIHYGIREHGMAGVMTGMAAHGGVVPVGGTFFVFSDYMRGAVRVAALSEAHVIYSWTHDSIGLGEDGPTHQPIEQLAAVRAMPNLRVIRPADANETAQAWRIAVDAAGPTALILTRQKIPVLSETVGAAAEGVPRGAYVLRPETDGGPPDIILIGTGSEVHLCLEAVSQLADRGIRARVVSFPSWELFALQDEVYQAEVFPTGVPRLAVEAATSFGWERYADDSVSIDHFGASASGERNMVEFGFTSENVTARAERLLGAIATD
jgi:transketolase